MIRLPSTSPRNITVVAIVAYPLFSLVGNVGTHGGDLLQRAKDFLALAVLGSIHGALSNCA